MNELAVQPPHAVIEFFAPATSGLRWRRAQLGFSGAVVWRGEDQNTTSRVALKAWPSAMSAERLQQMHEWMSQVEHLSFVPKLMKGKGGRTVHREGGRMWDACQWMSGEPRVNPTLAEIATACQAVARLHEAWPLATERVLCRGVANRIAMLLDNRALLAGPLPPVASELDPLLRRAAQTVARLAEPAVTALRPWAVRPVAVQPCMRDLRGEHVLFEEGRVSGIIDYGAMALDHPAVDLARLLDDYAGIDESKFAAGLAAYRNLRGGFNVPDEFVHLLAGTGALCSLMGWLVRLIGQSEPILQVLSVAARIGDLLGRVENYPQWQPL